MKISIATLAAIALAGAAGAAIGAPHGGASGMPGLSHPVTASPTSTSHTFNTSQTHTPVAAGKPNQSCQAQPNTPGNAADAPGSAFNPSGNAGLHYAGQQPQNSRNPNSVAQYDVACANQPGGTR
jgi:hypothetical protein